MDLQRNDIPNSVRMVFKKVLNKLDCFFRFPFEIFGIKFAPLIQPLERRFQTLAAAAWICLIVFGEAVSLCVMGYLFMSKYYWIPVLYVLYIINVVRSGNIDHLGKRRWSWTRRWKWWVYFQNYFPLKLVKTHDLDPEKNYLLCVFPHGILTTSVFGNFLTEAGHFHELFPGMTPHILTLAFHFVIPFFRELVLWMGGCSVSAKSMGYLLNTDNGKGRCVVLVVGGSAESLNCHPGEYRIILKNRKGFVKIAMKNGAPLVPVFSFGENDVYKQVSNPQGGRLRKIQDWIRKKTGVAPILPLGRGIFQYSFGLVPHRHPVTSVVGTPLEVVKNPLPTNEEIDKVHGEFIESLKRLFEENKHKYAINPKEAKLTVL